LENLQARNRKGHPHGLRGLQNCRLVVMLIGDGTPVSRAVRNAAVRTLLALATNDRVVHTRFDAAVELAKIEESRGFELLEQFAVDSAHPSRIRLSAATELARCGGESAVPVLRRLAMDAALQQEDRVSAALELTRQDPAVAAVPLARLAQNKAVGPDLRLQAAIELVLIDRELGQDALATLIGTYHNHPDRCLVVALELAKFDDPRAADVLRTLARHDTAGFEVRFSAAVELRRLSDPESDACLLGLATAQDVPAPNRLIAALELAKSAPGLGLRLVHELATDPGRHPDLRKNAAVQLIRFNDPRGHTALADLALSLPYDDESKFDVVSALAGLRDPLATRELALVADGETNPDSVVATEAARLLDHLVEVAGLDGWGGVARAADLSLGIRLDAVDRLGRIATVRARALLHELSDDRGLHPRVRDAARKTLA
jgi:hypothetical protein